MLDAGSNEPINVHNLLLLFPQINFAVIVLLSSELLIATYHGIVIEILNSK